MGIIGWIVLGLLAGAIAKAILPGDDPGGIFVTMTPPGSSPGMISFAIAPANRPSKIKPMIPILSSFR